MPRKIAIIGKGHVGSALAEGLQRAGHEIRFGSRDPKQPVREAAAWGEVVILAVPWKAHGGTAKEAGDALDGKTVIDVSNVMTENMELAIGGTTSAAEELQKLLPRAKIVKAFNTTFAQNMRTGRVHGERLTAFIAGDDAAAKATAMELAEDIGFDAVDSGDLKVARLLEALGLLYIRLGYGQGLGTDIGIELVRKAA